MASAAHAPILPQVARCVSALIADDLTILNSTLELAQPDLCRSDYLDMRDALRRIEWHRTQLQIASELP